MYAIWITPINLFCFFHIDTANDVQGQLENIKNRIHEDKLKNLYFTYYDLDGQIIDEVSKNGFHIFSLGSSIVVAGKLKKNKMLSKVKITALSCNGNYSKEFEFVHRPHHAGCSEAKATLCTGERNMP